MPRKLDIGLGLAGVPAQDLVRCLLEIAEPFAGMLGDLLRLYADVGARSADRENLRLRFDFGRGDPLDLLLSAFREQVEQLRRTVVARNARRWTSESLWDLLRLIPRLRSGETDDELFRAWQREYNERRWPDTVPRPAGTGVAIADEAIASCLAVVEQFMQDARSSASDRNALAPAIWGERPSDHYRQRVVAEQADPSEATISIADLAQADSDGWPAYLLAALFEFADRVRDVAATDGEAAQRFAAPIASAVGEHIRTRPRITVQVDEDVVHLIDLLSLPIWGKRHELYSAWVLTEIVAAISFDRIAVHVVNGVLEFRFSGSHLATISTTDGPVELWAELRSAYAKPIGHGRSRAIQPDYRFSQPPVTAPASAVLAVECKQYWRTVRKNAAEAMADYTGGLPNARVVVASHGKVSEKVQDKLTPDQRDRSVAISGLRPNSGQPIVDFRRAVADALPPPVQDDGSGISPATPLSITLTRAEVAADLKLHVKLVWPDGSFQWMNRDYPGDSSTSGAWLDHGSPDSSERITITTPVASLFILVLAFNGVLGNATHGVAVSIQGPRSTSRSLCLLTKHATWSLASGLWERSSAVRRSKSAANCCTGRSERVPEMDEDGG